MSLCSSADTLSMLSLIWVDIISLFTYTQDALQELLYYVLFDTEQLMLCSSTIKGKIFLKLFNLSLEYYFFQDCYSLSKMRKKSQFNGAYFLAPTTSFLMLGYISIKTHKFRLLRNCTPCLFHSGADKKKMKPQRIHSQWASYFWLFIKKSAQILWHNTKSKPVALRDSLSGELSQHITNPSYRIQRAK